MTSLEGSESGPKTVLLVEDSPTQARRTQIDLEREGFVVITASNGREALDIAADRLPDVILSDVLMPEVDGFRLCLEARMDRRLRSIPIILRSAQFSAPEDRGLARAAGADAYIEKDLSADQLAGIVREALEVARGERVFFDPETFRSEYGARLLARLVEKAADLERVNESLVENQARLQGLLDNAPTSIYVKDLQGRHIMANPRFQNVMNRALDDIIGKTDEDLFASEVADQLRSMDERVTATGSPVEFEETLSIDGELRFFNSIKFPLFDAEGNIQGLCTISTDVTERRMLEKELREFQKMETVGLLAGGIAHDFGNYLSAILAYAGFLEERIEAGDPRREDLTEIKRAAESATSLARQLMTLSRRESIAPEAIDLNELISDLTRLLAIAVGTGITVETNLATTLPPITIHPSHLEQALMNFAINARDAMPSGGMLLIETEGIDQEATEGEAQDEAGGLVRLRISDTGQGMSPETIGRIFDPFFTTKSRKKGTGLGLATVKKVIDEAGGRISVESTPGQGTVFDILLPAATSPEGSDTLTPPVEPDQRGETVLIVDDEPGVRSWLQEVFTSNGFHTVVAATAEAAEKFVERRGGHIDLVIADVFLPGRSGRELVQTLKEHIPDLEVIFISGILEVAFPEGSVDHDAIFMQKPFRAEALVENARRLLAARVRQE